MHELATYESQRWVSIECPNQTPVSSSNRLHTQMLNFPQTNGPPEKTPDDIRNSMNTRLANIRVAFRRGYFSRFEQPRRITFSPIHRAHNYQRQKFQLFYVPYVHCAAPIVILKSANCPSPRIVSSEIRVNLLCIKAVIGLKLTNQRQTSVERRVQSTKWCLGGNYFRDFALCARQTVLFVFTWRVQGEWMRRGTCIWET